MKKNKVMVLGGKKSCVGALEEVEFESNLELFLADGWRERRCGGREFHVSATQKLRLLSLWLSRTHVYNRCITL